MVSQRRRLLDYVKSKDNARYRSLIELSIPATIFPRSASMSICISKNHPTST
jgi:hypothetical protein